MHARPTWAITIVLASGVFSSAFSHEGTLSEYNFRDDVRPIFVEHCSGCHRPFGPTQSNMDLRFGTSWPEMNVCDVVPMLGTLGITDAKIIAPGDSARSILVDRMSRRDAYGMPPLGSNLVDAAAVDLILTWIDGLTACP